MKKNQKYTICCEEWTDEGVTCPCYGLVCEDVKIHYISPDRGFVERLADELNSRDPKPEPDEALAIIEEMLP